jgi:uncharacterized protein (DUF2252 family)
MSKAVSPEARSAALTQIRNLKMARSAHAYVRGSTESFYAWLDSGVGDVPTGPPVWICGDCHVGNLGPLADAKGRVAIQIRDLDQTVVGNPAHDLIRLALSLASAARGSNLPGVTTARILEAMTAGYHAALNGAFHRRHDHAHRPEMIQALLMRSVRRRWQHLAQERLEDARPTIPLGKRFWPLHADENEALRGLFEQPEIKSVVNSLKGRDDDGDIAVVDSAYWVKGCSSLGRLRYGVMLRLGHGDKANLCLVDVKEALKAAAPRSTEVSTPRDNAERVVQGAKALSPNLGGRMAPARLLDRAVVIRELMPQDLKLDVEQLSEDEAVALAAYLARVLGWSHGRQMDEATRKAWARDLTKAQKRSLEAPSWLWTAVVELLSIHEAAYLEHCRRFALPQVA